MDTNYAFIRLARTAACILIGLLLTAPYGHGGDVETLAEVVRRHAGDGQPAGSPSLTPREQTDVVVLLESLSTFANPWRPEDAGRCY